MISFDLLADYIAEAVGRQVIPVFQPKLIDGYILKCVNRVFMSEFGISNGKPLGYISITVVYSGGSADSLFRIRFKEECVYIGTNLEENWSYAVAIDYRNPNFVQLIMETIKNKMPEVVQSHLWKQ